MKKHLYIPIFLITLLFGLQNVEAGNGDRVGEAGSLDLLINPWARSSGFHSLNTASVWGLEAMRLNVGGLAFVDQTEIAFSSTRWLEGSDITISSFGFAQHVGESGVFGVNVMSMSFGDLIRTTVDQPDGGDGSTFSPRYTNIGLAYSKSFSESIHGGILVRLVNQSIADVSAGGIAFDTGIQYVTGPNDNVKFGISLRNVGTPMQYSGDGLNVAYEATTGATINGEQRPAAFELPTLLNIGGAYDFYIGDRHRITAVANFTSNSFRGDFIGAGLEYAFNEMFMLRGGFKYEDGMFEEEIALGSSALNGFAGGLSVNVPFKEDGPQIGIDYSYRTTTVFNGVHSFSVKINL